MAVVTMKSLLEAGVHFGHQTKKWNPKMSKYIYSARNDIHIIDLQISVEQVEKAYAFVRDVAKEGKSSSRRYQRRSSTLRYVLYEPKMAWRYVDQFQNYQKPYRET